VFQGAVFIMERSSLCIFWVLAFARMTADLRSASQLQAVGVQFAPMPHQ
jgi:hypothetical protein